MQQEGNKGPKYNIEIFREHLIILVIDTIVTNGCRDTEVIWWWKNEGKIKYVYGIIIKS